MCGRFENTLSLQSVFDLLKENGIKAEILDKKTKTGLTNIPPTAKIISISKNESKHIVSPVNWGIKFSPKSPLIFNSRIETIRDKKFWWNLLGRNRTIVPMTGFYEWKKEGTRKQPYRIYLPEEDVFYVPALFHKMKDEIFASLITTTPNKFIKKVHHRMPVIIDFPTAMRFLDSDVNDAVEICKPYSDKKKMDMEAVDL